MKHHAFFIGIAVFFAFAIWFLFFSRPDEASLVVHVGGPTWSGVLMLILGIAFFASYVFQQAAFAKPFLFICQHFSSPASDKMALFYGALLSIGGIAVVINAL
ncbi:hypothetical protein [Marinobacter sp. F4206]|uniref:hypothetical protein n=1 Tax=Marinobacter sp. F4206 TaxID=2861777 RepID=UPI001C5F9F95|nr:hypothetical protein [Marinobacter sp. F4206]MBW4936653.1 hypothetical protein [Marinobacter sp. F4206]